MMMRYSSGKVGYKLYSGGSYTNKTEEFIVWSGVNSVRFCALSSLKRAIDEHKLAFLIYKVHLLEPA